jgi:hypothetical protein
VLKRIETRDDEAEQFLVKVGDGSREDFMTYNSIINILSKLIEAESQEAEDERVFTFKSVDAHQKGGNTFEVILPFFAFLKKGGCHSRLGFRAISFFHPMAVSRV